MPRKVYQVIMKDEWNNLYCLGFFNTLEEALPEVNEWLSTYDTTIDEIFEYPSTFSMCFDQDIEVEDGQNCVYLRGFILDKDKIKEVLK